MRFGSGTVIFTDYGNYLVKTSLVKVLKIVGRNIMTTQYGSEQTTETEAKDEGNTNISVNHRLNYLEALRQITKKIHNCYKILIYDYTNLTTFEVSDSYTIKTK